MSGERALGLLLELSKLPSVPFGEDAVVEAAGRFGVEVGVEIEADAAGNLWLQWPGRSSRRGWVLTAHLDHPGFRVMSASGSDAEALWFGGVDSQLFEGTRVRLLGSEPIRGRIRAHSRLAAGARRLSIRFERAVSVGAIGRWDLPPDETSGDWIAAPAIDDLAGVAWALEALRWAVEQQLAQPVTVLLTRAEEAGFVGSLVAVRERRGLDDAWVNLEASPATESASPGAGVVIRTGDAWSEFDADLTDHLARAGQSGAELSARLARMPGGVCEGTIFQAGGRRCGALTLPLRYHHNQGPDGTPMLERCHVRDFVAGAALLRRAIAEPPPEPVGPTSSRPGLLARLERWVAPWTGQLRTS